MESGSPLRRRRYHACLGPGSRNDAREHEAVGAHIRIDEIPEYPALLLICKILEGQKTQPLNESSCLIAGAAVRHNHVPPVYCAAHPDLRYVPAGEHPDPHFGRHTIRSPVCSFRKEPRRSKKVSRISQEKSKKADQDGPGAGSRFAPVSLRPMVS